MRREVLDYMLSGCGGRLLNRFEDEQLQAVLERIEKPAWNDERDRAARTKDAQQDLRNIVTLALDRLCQSVAESSQGAMIIARMGLGEVSEMDKAQEDAAKEVVTMMTAIRTGHPLDPEKIAGGEFLITE